MNRLLAAARRPRAYTLALLGVVLIGSLLGAQAANQADVVLPACRWAESPSPVWNRRSWLHGSRRPHAPSSDAR